MKVFLLAILLSFLTSCAGSVKVLGRGCQTFDAQFMDVNKTFSPDKTWQQKVWTYGGNKEKATTFTLRELLTSKEIECKNVQSLRITIGQSFWDQIFSMAIFAQRMTMTIEVQTKS